MIVGRLIGKSCRAAFELKIAPSRVVKLGSCDMGIDANRREWQFYAAAQGTMFESWIAPCHHISECGRLLVMDRCEPIPAEMASGIQIPKIFSDTKIANWGLLAGRPVCLDYALTCGQPNDPNAHNWGMRYPWPTGYQGLGCEWANPTL